MAQKIIRNIPDDVMAAIEQKAQAAGVSSEEWIRGLLVREASTPIVRERYAYRVYAKSGARGKITRHSDHPNGTSATYENFNEDEAKVLSRAADLMRRNDPGDREKAVALLQSAFEEVMEVPV